jgi:uncharacterized lipoprotein YajG
MLAHRLTHMKNETSLPSIVVLLSAIVLLTACKPSSNDAPGRGRRAGSKR